MGVGVWTLNRHPFDVFIKNQKSDLPRKDAVPIILCSQKRDTLLALMQPPFYVCIKESRVVPNLSSTISSPRFYQISQIWYVSVSYYSTIEKFCKKKVSIKEMRFYGFSVLTEALIISATDPLTGRAITFGRFFTMTVDIRLTRLCSGFKSFESL